ncbi:ATP-binding protein [Vibrio galatheae]|uniref:ATP-binding protein n=1 Tax=Vibrio galatheae TaxID=579748 RepID=UPI00138DF330|nr:ATP-binding protein [Vibrio galatheae]
MTLQIETEEKVNTVQQDIFQNIRVIKFLHSTPPISGITRALSNNNVDALDNTTLEQWKSRLSVIFKSWIENDPAIKQLRIISVEDKGHEFLRVDRDGGRVIVVGESRLQDKSNEPYYEPSAKLGAGELYVSSVNLNKEYGKISYPLQPTYRIALPIFYDNGNRFGFIIMNIDSTELFNALYKDSKTLDASWIVDSDGYFISSSDNALAFTRQLAPEVTLESSYHIEPMSRSHLMTLISLSDPQEQWFAHKVTLITGNDMERKMYVYGLISKNKIMAEISHRRSEILYLGLFAVLVIATVLAFFYRSYSSSLKLNKANSIFQAIINSSVDAVICVSPLGQVKTWNGAASHLFNVQSNMALNRPLSKLIWFNKANVMDKIEQCKNEKTVIKFQDSVTFGEERKVYIDVIISPVFLRNIEEIDSYVISARDVTESVEAQDKLKQYNAELEKEVDKRTEEIRQHSEALEEAHGKALEASQAKSNFISTISHEMRTPLNGMVGTLSLVRNGPLNPEQQRYLAMAESSVGTLALLINDILDLSKIESGKLEVHYQPFSPRDVIETMVQSNAVKAYEKGLDVILDTTQVHYQSVLSDPNRLKQVLNNLMNNAIKFTQQGMIKVIASTEVIEDKFVRLNVGVIDSGIGIAAENQHRLFQPFSQEGPETSAKFGGTGLGLSICRQLCELMNGHIDFESKQGIGSHFYFYIDIDVADCELMSSEHELQGSTIGIAISDNALSEVIERALDNWGANHQAVSEPVDNWVAQLDSIITEKHSPYYQSIVDAAAADNTKADLQVIELNASSVMPPYLVAGNPNIVIVSKPLLSTDLLTALSGKFNTVKESVSHTKQRLLEADLSALHILVVDDNQINQEVAKGFLVPLGAKVECAENGQEALGCIEQAERDGNTFDCILMDCQMPIMNGYECSQTLRLNSKFNGGPDIPIIAMTANAFSGEEEKCLAHGMNDYITKPVDSTLLIEKILRWTLNRRHTAPTQPLTRTESKPLPDNYSGWNKDVALKRLGGNQALFTKIVSIFQQDAAKDIELLHKAINAREVDEIAHWSHKLKGLCGDIGAEELLTLMAMLEDEVRRTESVNFERVEQVFERCSQEYTHLMAAIEQTQQQSIAS